MGRLIIERSSEWNNKALDMGLYLNKSKLENISDGEIMKFNLETGEYYLEAKLGIWRSKPFKIKMTPDTVKKVELRGIPYGEGFLIFCFSLIITVVLGEIDVLHLDLFWLTFIPLMGLSIYYVTLGRRNYLRLIEPK
ncbi:MAG: hypothetical protein R6W85_08065 [Gillisia sp.]